MEAWNIFSGLKIARQGETKDICITSEFGFVLESYLSKPIKSWIYDIDSNWIVDGPILFLNIIH